MILSVRSLTQFSDRTMDHIDRHLHEVGDPKDNSDQLDAVIVTGIMVTLLVSLISLLYLAQYIVSKWWPSAHVERSVPTRSAMPSTTTTKNLPFSSKIRKVYLETKLKSEVFHSVGGGLDVDIENGISQNNVCSKRVPSENLKSMESSDTCSSVVTNSDHNSSSCDEDNEINGNCDESDPTNDIGWFDEGGEKNVPQCLICFEAYLEGDEFVRHCMNKTYHRTCIVEWLMRNDNCPYCRSAYLDLSTIDEQ